MLSTKKTSAVLLAAVLTLMLLLTACGAKDNGDSNIGDNSAPGNSSTSGGKNSPYSSAKVGDVIQFGGYGWRVLDKQDGKTLI